MSEQARIVALTVEREALIAERAVVRRLRAALAAYADPANWQDIYHDGNCREWDGDGRAGWVLAQGALDALRAPETHGKDEEA